jgi:hypothetical protein
MTTPGPIIYQNQTTPTLAPRFSWPFFIFRILSLALVAVILFMIFQAAMLFISRLGSQNLKFAEIPINVDRTPSITLNPEKNTLSVGQTGNLTIDYFTANKTIQGIDVVLKYDPSALEFAPNFFSAGPVFTQYPITQISPSDTIRISAVATVSQIGFNGSGTLGTIQFVAKKIGQTKIEIVYQENQTTETNLVELQSGQEILQLVKGATIDIK